MAFVSSSWFYIYIFLSSFFPMVKRVFIEGCNNKIKVLKRIAFGYRRFYISVNVSFLQIILPKT